MQEEHTATLFHSFQFCLCGHLGECWPGHARCPPSNVLGNPRPVEKHFPLVAKQLDHGKTTTGVLLALSSRIARLVTLDQEETRQRLETFELASSSEFRHSLRRLLKFGQSVFAMGAPRDVKQHDRVVRQCLADARLVDWVPDQIRKRLTRKLGRVDEVGFWWWFDSVFCTTSFLLAASMSDERKADQEHNGGTRQPITPHSDANVNDANFTKTVI
mmetsp:Transcript_138/g.498  ORF Transcript_138/g.498 Transcript_138/m.498 type:complete len:216 (+) Transcript_138:839-1486(+)